MTTPQRFVVHAYVSKEADDTLTFLTETTGVSKTAIVQTWLEGIGTKMAALGWDDDSARTVMGEDFLRAGRKVDSLKRTRTRTRT